MENIELEKIFPQLLEERRYQTRQLQTFTIFSIIYNITAFLGLLYVSTHQHNFIVLIFCLLCLLATVVIFTKTLQIHSIILLLKGRINKIEKNNELTSYLSFELSNRNKLKVGSATIFNSFCLLMWVFFTLFAIVKTTGGL